MSFQRAVQRGHDKTHFSCQGRVWQAELECPFRGPRGWTSGVKRGSVPKQGAGARAGGLLVGLSSRATTWPDRMSGAAGNAPRFADPAHYSAPAITRHSRPATCPEASRAFPHYLSKTGVKRERGLEAPVRGISPRARAGCQPPGSLTGG